MTAFKQAIVFFLLLIAGFNAAAQTTSEDINAMKPGRLKRFGQQAARMGDPYSAIDYFQRYLELKPGNSGITYLLAQQYLRARDYATALELFKTVYDADPDKYTLALFYYAQMLQMTGKHKEAEPLFNKFRKAYRDGPDSKKYTTLAKECAEGCKIAPSLIDSALEVEITHLDTSINKAHVEFSPISVAADQMIYASLKSDKILYVVIDSAENMPVRKFYAAKKEGETWKSTGEFTGPFNQDKVNTGNGAFSPDGQRFYFTRCQPNEMDQVVCAIYISYLREGKWTSPEKLNDEINDPRYTSTQPTVGTDSRKGDEILYFVSDRPGGKGGLDIWYTTYNAKKNIFKEPKKAGSKINSVGDEMTPYFDMETRTLYFSSDGFPGLGGLDIFKSVGERTRWSEPQNVGYPINSVADDIYFTVGKTREEGFFVSNREGGVALKNPTCCDDIYSYRWLKYVHVAI
ncbi:MAG: PD40 domain-containing protein, partial [Flavobacteriales bacterium]|nr:PD40 domain-containing protein [Flavobacteriales bacterium]